MIVPNSLATFLPVEIVPLTSSFVCGSSSPIPIKPADVMRSLSSSDVLVDVENTSLPGTALLLTDPSTYAEIDAQ